ncbi:MAG: hypothetical protein WC881_09520 [Elusimicrobiota bacterium]|jgi:hypothetical protein
MSLRRELMFSISLLWLSVGPALAAAGQGAAHAQNSPSETFKAALGKCLGTAKAQPRQDDPASPAVDLKAQPLDPEDADMLRLLGYQVDALAGRLTAPQGAAVSTAQLARLRGAFNARHEYFDDSIWTGLMLAGFRLDERSCHLLNPKTKRALDRLTAQYLRKVYSRKINHQALENLNILLQSLPPGQGLSLEDAAAARTLAKHAGLPSLGKALSARSINPEALAGKVDAAYERSSRFWDNGARADASIPIEAGAVHPVKAPTYFDETERVLSKDLAHDITVHLERNGPGRELLAHFRDEAGQVQLPDVFLLKLSQKPSAPGQDQSAALYHAKTASVALNHWAVADAVLTAAPPDRQARLSEQLASPQKLGLYLYLNAQARAAFIARNDHTIFHELVHAWQAKRDKFTVEQLRGNIAPATFLPNEHEAFREESRYFHAKLLADPAAAAQSSDLDSYLRLLRDYDQFRDDISRRHLSHQLAGDIQTLQELQAARTGVAQRLSQKLRGLKANQQLLRKLGLDLGSQALQETHQDHISREQDFVEYQLPKMRREAYPKLAAQLLKDGRPGAALALIAGARHKPKEEQPLFDPALEQKTLQATLARLEQDPPPPDFSWKERIKAVTAAAEYMVATEYPGGQKFADLYQREHRNAVKALLAEAQAARDPDTRKRLLDSAQAHAGALGQSDELEKQMTALRRKKR